MKKITKKPKEPELIHIKFEHSEMLQSKRDILSLQMELLKLLKTVKKYHFLKMAEMKRKEALYKTVKQTNNKLKSLQAHLPKPKIPSLLKRPHHEKTTMPTKKTHSVPSDQNLEMQLEEIQNRLQELQK